MKTKPFIICFIILLISTSALAQWTKLNITPNHRVNSYDFLDDNIGYASLLNINTNRVEFAKTVDGGNSWSILNSPSSAFDFKDMSAPANSIIYAAYRDPSAAPPNPSKIYKTSNDGNTWSDITPATTNMGMGFAAVYFVDEFIGYWVISEKLYKTTDGGANWTSSELPLGHYALSSHSIHFNDASNGVIGTWDGTFGYYGGILSTSDGGLTWSNTTFTINSAVISSVKQTSANVAYAATAGWGGGVPLLYKTTNTGATWSEIPIPNTLSNPIIRSFDFLDDYFGFIVEEVNDTSYIYKTLNGGVSWSLYQVLDAPFLSEMHLTSNTGYLAAKYQTQFFKLKNATGLNELVKDHLIHIYPNPFTTSTTIEFENKKKEKHTLVIYNTSGQLVLEIDNITNGSVTIERENLASGLYFFQVMNNTGSVKNGKIVIE